MPALLEYHEIEAIVAERMKTLASNGARVTAHYAADDAQRAALAKCSEPIPMILFCPKCGTQHIDKAEEPQACGANGSQGCWIKPCGPNGEEQCEFCGSAPLWDNPPHRSHECQKCMYVWRPADVATTGVATIKTAGKNDDPPINNRAAPAKGGT